MQKTIITFIVKVVAALFGVKRLLGKVLVEHTTVKAMTDGVIVGKFDPLTRDITVLVMPVKAGRLYWRAHELMHTICHETWHLVQWKHSPFLMTRPMPKFMTRHHLQLAETWWEEEKDGYDPERREVEIQAQAVAYYAVDLRVMQPLIRLLEWVV